MKHEDFVEKIKATPAYAELLPIHGERLYKERKAYADAKKRGDYDTMGAIRELLFSALTK